ncbi:enoyl-CoA hydratase/isomerase family protein [Dyadobacter bucti]|uniref:enoyl-CoA hydratase/isomerase family protein n=1 Tax=Dyadobacter bucti TaxID=2572203 RepID=UPI003F711B6B
MYQHITFSNNDGIVTITLNRPEVYHALNAAMMQEITQAIGEAGTDDSARVVIITGEGNKAFSSGADLKHAVNSSRSAGDMLEMYYNPMILAIRNILKPVICRLNGLAVGAGCSLAIACDMIIASEDAYLSLLFVQIGLMPDAGATFFLPRRIGMARAFELAATGKKVCAPEAEQIGLINKSVPAGELDKETALLASYYRTAPTLAIGAMKQVLNQSYESDLQKMLNLEVANQDKLFKSQDAAEGISSFLQKKKPDFQGK